MNKKKSKNRGFTLVETLVAITILVVSIAGPITIASKGMASAVFAKDQIVAFYLAQEAVEYIRNKRDENNIKDNDWLNGLSDCIDENICTVDIQNNTISKCPGGGCPVLKYDDSDGFYNYASGNDSNFTRSVNIEIVNVKEVSITATLSWKTGVIDKTFTVKEHVLDW
ncbi:MAG: prepilin-type N-terminal cleavage/methylation domain-containing protein [Candidatus Paceibacteria bacterium]